jgi:quercetin dioxygenase-like cupin family protein
MNAGHVVPPGTGRRFRVGPNELTVKAGAGSGHTLVGVFESSLPPGGGFPLAHIHDEYEEIFYVLDGEIEYRIGDAWTTAGAGSTICVPSGVVHAFRNASARSARHLVVHAPAVALTMIEELGQAPEDRFEAILAKHRTRFAEGQQPWVWRAQAGSSGRGPLGDATQPGRS